jgi:hypothetical protein
MVVVPQEKYTEVSKFHCSSKYIFLYQIIDGRLPVFPATTISTSCGFPYIDKTILANINTLYLPNADDYIWLDILLIFTSNLLSPDKVTTLTPLALIHSHILSIADLDL